jgi:phytoene dehydrogenase-like protein
MSATRRDVVVVGAGLAGLRCAGLLSRAGLDVAVLEGSDAVGGRVRTDRVEGFLLDRGFQVFNDAYPAARRALDLRALELRPMESAVVVRRGGRLHRVGNPLADPRDALSLVGTDLVGWGQKLRLGTYAAATATLPASRLLGREDVSARDAWIDGGVSQETVESVLRPFFAGVVLEEEMATTRRFLDLMMRMFARGRSTVPAAGMQAIPDQLAAALPPGSLRLGCPVASVHDRGVQLESGEEVPAERVVVATDAWAAHRLLPVLGDPPAAHGVTTVYHSAPAVPGQRSTLRADADGSPVANSIVLSAAAPSYAPAGRALVSTSVVHGTDGARPATDDLLLPVLAELHEQDTTDWQRLAEYVILDALPAMPAPHDFVKPVRIGTAYVAGDHRDTSSIQGALVSGRRAAEAVLADR